MPDNIFYVGTYSVRGSAGIYVYRLDPQSGAVAPVGTASGGVHSPSFLALHPSGKFLYAVGEEKAGSVGAYAIDAQTAIPKALNTQSSLGSAPCHICIDASGRCALIANYGSGSVGVLPIAPDGTLAPIADLVQDQGASHIFPGRQDAPHAHSVQADPSGRHAIAVDLGCDKLFLFRFDPARAALTPAAPPSIATAPGSGPRHMAFHPNGRFLFVIHELNSTIAAYRYDAGHGGLTPLQTLSTLPENFSGTSWCAEVVAHPNGKFVYGSNRGHDSLAAFVVDPANGSLRSIGFFPTQGKNPRHFAIDPSGAFLIAANQDGDSLVVFRIDAATGHLTPTGQKIVVPSPVCVLFAKS